MKLLTNATSPFARLVHIAIDEFNLPKPKFIEIDPWTFSSRLINGNPFSTVPALITSDNEGVYESLIIIDYLFTLNKQTLIIDNYSLYSFGKALMEQSYRHISLLRNTPKDSEPHPFIAITEKMLKNALSSLPSYLTQWKLNNHLPSLQLMAALDYLQFRLPEIFPVPLDNLLPLLESYQQRNSFQKSDPRKLS